MRSLGLVGHRPDHVRGVNVLYIRTLHEPQPPLMCLNYAMPASDNLPWAGDCAASEDQTPGEAEAEFSMNSSLKPRAGLLQSATINNEQNMMPIEHAGIQACGGRRLEGQP